MGSPKIPQDDYFLHIATQGFDPFAIIFIFSVIVNLFFFSVSLRAHVITIIGPHCNHNWQSVAREQIRHKIDHRLGTTRTIQLG